MAKPDNVSIRGGGAVSGRGVFANHALPAGSVVLREQPWLCAGSNWELVRAFLSQPATRPADLSSVADLLNYYKRNSVFKLAWDQDDERCLADFTNRREALWVLDVVVTNCLCTNATLLLRAGHPEPRRPWPRRVGMFKQLAMVNHSCVPNCAFLPARDVGATELTLVAQRDIAAGEELTIGYIRSTDMRAIPRDLRRQYLLREFGFVCKCAACTQA